MFWEDEDLGWEGGRQGTCICQHRTLHLGAYVTHENICCREEVQPCYCNENGLCGIDGTQQTGTVDWNAHV